MSKRMKTFTKIISLILVVIMFAETCPMSALAALVADVQGDGAVVESYDESRNFYYDSHSIDVGRAGTLSLNDYTLSPSLSFDALGIDGNVLPVSVSMKYNPSEYRFLKDVMKYTPTAYGNGWLTNYNSMLCELENENSTQLAYVSGTGAVIVFEPDETDTSKWVLPEIEDIYILKSADASYTMYTDSATRVFDTYGRLTSLVNTANSATNTVQYVCNDGTNLEDIAKIIDGVGNEYRFTYTDGLLTKIKCYNSDGNAIIAGDGENSAPLEMNFAYTSGNLITVTFPDGKTVSYGYNSADVMLRAVNIDGYKAEITFADAFATKLAEFSPNGTEGGYVNITRNENTRTFTDDKGKVQIKTFDDTGKILTIVDGDGNYLYGAPIQDEEDSTVTEEDSSDYIYEEDITETYESVCPCSDCTEWECVCECESEEVCTCVQCKRYSDTTEDEHGNVLSEESFDGTKTMKSQNTYTSDGNYLASSVDTSGNTVYYIYDEAGFMQSMTSGDTEVLFDYDAMGNLTRLYQQVSGLSNGTTMSNQYTYNNDRVSSITHNGFTYNFTYDEWGNQTSVKINDRVYYSNEYSGENHDRLSKINYSNGQSVTYTYDSNNNIAGVSYDNGLTNAFAYEYDDNGELIKITDNDAGYITTYSNNGYEIRTFDNELMYSTVTNENGTVTENLFGSAITYSFNSEYNQITGKTTSSRSFSKYTSVVNDDYEAVENQIDYGSLVTTDWFGRISEKELNVDTINITDDILSEYSVSGQTIYTYADSETTATTKILSQTSTFASDINTVSRTDFYDYDATGNITGIYRYVDGVKTYFYTYEYDEAGQLVRENLIEDNKTIIYLYDIGGNIVSKTVYAYTSGDITEEMIPIETTEFGYNYSECNDLLTDFTYTKTGSSDSTIDSFVDNDYMGNVTRFNGVDFIWKAGRQLSRTYNNGDETRQFYNSDGMLIRIDSYVNGSLNEQMHYTWDGDRLISRTIENSSGKITSRIIYDAEGEAVGFIAEAPAVLDHDSVFLYRKNLQGDITGLIDEHGELWYEITYDAYGVHTLHIPGAPNNTLAQGIKAFVGLLLTPQLYRGYVYSIVGDMYTYYLGSRYYVPQFCRFFNADKHSDTQTGVLATNMFAYCNNNPVMYVDPSGEVPTLDSKNPILGFYNLEGNRYLTSPWSTVPDAWQRKLGYCDLYDKLAPLAGIWIDCLVSEFRYGDKNWRIELWKGRYGISVGAEIGIYNSKTSTKFYNCAEDEDMLNMAFSLFYIADKYTGRVRLFMGRGPEAHWWLTGFMYTPWSTELSINGKPKHNNLVMMATIVFKDEEMAENFKNGIKSKKSDGYWDIKISRNSVLILWAPANRDYYV